MTTSAHPPGTPARMLQLIRTAITLGVLLFIVVAVQVRRTPSVPPAAVGYTAAGFAVFMLATLLFVRSRYASASSRAQRSTFCIVAWAIGEMTALFGITSYLIGNPFTTLVPGLLVFAASLLLIPIPEDA